MSTKIYEAYRFPAEKLDEFLAHVRPRMLKGFFEKIERLMVLGWTKKELDAIDEKVACLDYLKDATPERIEATRERYRWYALQSKLRSASVSFEKSAYNVDASWNLWIYNGWVYTIPYGRYKHGAKELNFVEDFSFWNNSDGPDDVPEEEFRARGEVWEKVCLNDWNGTRLNHVVVDFSNPSPHAAMLAEEKLFGLRT